jgi:hypothetical protein
MRGAWVVLLVSGVAGADLSGSLGPCAAKGVGCQPFVRADGNGAIVGARLLLDSSGWFHLLVLASDGKWHQTGDLAPLKAYWDDAGFDTVESETLTVTGDQVVWRYHVKSEGVDGLGSGEYFSSVERYQLTATLGKKGLKWKRRRR